MLSSCSSTFKNWMGEEETKDRNEKLLEDFKVENDILNKFEEKEAKKTPEVAKKQGATKKMLPEKKEKLKAEPIRTAIRPKPGRKLKKKTPLKVEKKAKVVKEKAAKPVVPASKYPEKFPKKLEDLDLESEKFWSHFTPYIFDREKIVLGISYMGVTTGKITVRSYLNKMIGNQNVYHINARVKTSDYYSYLYKVDDICDSYVTKDLFKPLKFSLIQRETSQNIDDLQLFDHDRMKTFTFYKRETKKKTKKKKREKFVPYYFQDPLSVLYFVRGLPFEKGKEYKVPIVNQGKVEILSARLDKFETINTNIGKRKAFKVSIHTKTKGKTIKGGDMHFWFSADEKRVFLKLKAKISIGTITGEIEKYEG